MTKRLQVLLDDEELQDIQRVAREQRLTTAAWVRRELRRARQDHGAQDAASKLAAIRKAVSYSFPTGDIERMNEEIERGYLESHG
jgi:hypothetical protein